MIAQWVAEMIGLAPPESAHPAGWVWLAAWQNAFMLSIDGFLDVLFATYVWRRVAEQMREIGWEALRWRSPSTDAAIALGAYFFGMIVTRLALWLVRYGFLSVNTSTAMLALGLAFAMWALTCLMRIFARGPWGPRAWLFCVAVSLMLAFALT